MYKLVISDDEGKTIIVPLVRDLITVGRQHGNTIRLTERNVSRQHARLVKAASGYRVEDLGSYNGVTLNGERMDGAAELKDGDRIGIGDYVIAFKEEADVLAYPPSVPQGTPGPAVLPGTPPARLVMMSAPAPGAEFSISKPSVRIGRLEELDLCISHRSISREHARITQREGGFDIVDLESANGIRVNGSAVKRSLLRSGDVVELGQVRFRFVGPGENYTFDASAEDALASLSASSAPKARTVVAVVATAALMGGALAYFEREDPWSAGAADGNPPSPDERLAPEMSAAQVERAQHADAQARLSEARARCGQALDAGQYEEAKALAQAGLAQAAADAALAACAQRAEQELRAMRAFREGQRALAEDRLEDAYFMFAGIPDDSTYRSRPEVAETTRRVAQQRLVEARKTLRADPEAAQELASSVLEMSGLESELGDEAKRVVTLAGRAADRAAAPSVKRAGSGNKKPPSGGAASRPAPASGDESPAKVAKSCLARGDQRCVVRALEGHTQNAQELALLIETYRALGETKKAVKHMRTFLTRHPAARQASQYRQFIAKHE